MGAIDQYQDDWEKIVCPKCKKQVMHKAFPMKLMEQMMSGKLLDVDSIEKLVDFNDQFIEETCKCPATPPNSINKWVVV